MMADLGDTGDYLYELGWYEQQANQADDSGIKQNYVDILSSQRAGRIVVPERERESDLVIRMTDDEKAQIIAQAKEIQGKVKQAKTQEEKDYYKRALKDLKEGETSAVKSRRKQREEALIASAPVAFQAQNVPKRKYWGPANIVEGMIQTDREVGSRPLTDTEEQLYMGKGTTGQTERYTSDAYSDTFSVREYQPPEGSGVLRLRDLDNIPPWASAVGENLDRPPATTDESGYEYPVEQLTRLDDDWSLSVNRYTKPEVSRQIPERLPMRPVRADEMPPTMLIKSQKVVKTPGKKGTTMKPVPAGVDTSVSFGGVSVRVKGGDPVDNPMDREQPGKETKTTFRYNTGKSNEQIRTYGRKRDPKTGKYVKYKG
jgi:hypothetical protein